MKHLLRNLVLTCALVQASIALAQPTPPFNVTVTGSVVGCTPNSIVNIVTVQGTQPSLDIDVPVDPADCSFWIDLSMDSYQGWFMVSTQCGGVNQSQNVNYTVNVLNPDTNMVTVVFNCNNTIDCLNVPGGNALPGTPCNTPAGNMGVYDAQCNCVETSTAVEACISVDQIAPFTAVFSSCTIGGTPAYDNLWDFSDGGAVPGDNISHTYTGPGVYTVCLNVTDQNEVFDATCEQVYVDANGGISFDPPAGCEACFTVIPVMNGNNPVPFQANFINCSTGAPTLSYIWTLPNGLNSSQQNQQNYTFNAPGIYGLCLQITDGSGCTSELCDTIVVDPNGGINTIPAWYDCMGVLWGNSTAGTPCNHPVTGPGTWSADCDCVPNSTVYDCLQIPNGPNLPGTPCQQAGFIGTWDADCNCVPNSPGDCEAGFWVLQAYENGDTTGNGTPIPNTLWVWNLSNGGTGFYQFVWDFGDGSTSTEAFPTHIYADSGPYELCLTITDSDGCTDTYCDSLSVDEDGIYSGLIGDTGNRTALTLNVVNPLTTGIDEEEMLATISLWPNPARELLNIALDSRTAGSVRLEVVDLNGRIVLERQEQLNLGGNRLQLGTEDLPAGLYALRISQGTNVITQRFVRD
ncbi:MAG: PKD domain-containing protein [Flavobacteriales bacterium]|nr:PKD domain-containing protein [Flavobacteriales bacterium]